MQQKSNICPYSSPYKRHGHVTRTGNKKTLKSMFFSDYAMYQCDNRTLLSGYPELKSLADPLIYGAANYNSLILHARAFLSVVVLDGLAKRDLIPPSLSCI